MNETRRPFKVPYHVGLIVRLSDVNLAQEVVDDFVAYCASKPGVQLVHQDGDIEKLWLMKGPEPPWTRRHRERE